MDSIIKSIKCFSKIMSVRSKCDVNVVYLFCHSLNNSNFINLVTNAK